MNIIHPKQYSNERNNQSSDTESGVEEIGIEDYYENKNEITNNQTPKNISPIKPHTHSISPPKSPNISQNSQYQYFPKINQEYKPPRTINPLPPEIPPPNPNNINLQSSQNLTIRGQSSDNGFLHPSVTIPKYYTFTYHGIGVKFPYENPYEAQKQLISNAILALQKRQNALLESPTGTGKSLALLSAALSFLEVCPTITKLYYTSRTHIQLQQLVGELKKLPYFPQFSILASKRHLCLVPEVANSNSPEYTCRKLCEDESCPYNKPDINQNKKVIDIEDAPVVRSNPNSSVPFEFTNRGSKPKFDLDDLKEYGRKHSICPYQLAFNIYQCSQFVLCPYNYILKANDDKNLLLDFPKDSTIAIFDEGHNIESTAREDASLVLSYKQVDDARKATQYAPDDDCYKPLFRQVQQIQTDILNFIDQKRKEYDQNYNDKNKIRKPKYLCASSLRSVFVNIDIGLISSVGLQMANWLKILSNSDENDRQSMYMNDVVISFFSTCADVFLVFSISAFDFYRIVFVPDENGNKNKDEFHLLCLKPSFLFDKINHKTRSIIISSGTLSPLESFAAELEASFPIRVSAPHVVDPSQVLTISINSLQNIRITSRFVYLQSRGDEVYRALANILTKTLKTVPGGSLFFTPSYYTKDSILREWKSSNLFDEISRIKPIVEERSNLSAHAIISEYTSFPDGALLVGVCRGKVSEGLDFSDDLSRIVYVFGIPYPNIKNATVELKMRYNDLRHGTNSSYLSGDEWYNCQAFRALFQSVGRCLRHTCDYGAIVFLDDRIDSNIKKLPNWMKTNFHQALDVNQAERLLSSFYSEMKKKYPSQNSMGSSLLSFRTQSNSLNSNTSPKNRNNNSYNQISQKLTSFNLNRNDDQKLNDNKSEKLLMSAAALKAGSFNSLLQGKDHFDVKPEKPPILPNTKKSFDLKADEKPNHEDITDDDSFDDVCIIYEKPNNNNSNYNNNNNSNYNNNNNSNYNNNNNNNYNNNNNNYNNNNNNYNNNNNNYNNNNNIKNSKNNYSNNNSNNNSPILIQNDVKTKPNNSHKNIFLTDMFCKICGSLIIQIKSLDFADSKMIEIPEYFEILGMSVNKAEVMYIMEDAVEADLTKSGIEIICENDSMKLERRECPRCGCPIAAYVVWANKNSSLKKGELLFRQDILAMEDEGKILSLIELAVKYSE